MPALINGIWQFHVYTNGWCDIGYNFLVDRFGGVWEGRAGGITRAVIGAHAGGFNAGSTGISLIGDFTGDAPPGEMYDALIRTLAWKLDLHGAPPTGQVLVKAGQYSGSNYATGSYVWLWTIIGHRDVDSTACPGNAGYGLMQRIRFDVQKRMSDNQSGTARDGYWLVASDGGIFAFGQAQFHGSTGSIHLNQPIVGMAATPTGNGYWLVASDGGIFAFGDASFRGSTGSIRLNKPVVGMAADSATGGYWLVASDGGVFAFDAPFYGSTGSIRLASPIVGMTATADGGGYRFVAGDGGVFSFGGATFRGSATGGTIGAPIRSMSISLIVDGYRLVGANGVIYDFSTPFYGSAGGIALSQPIVAMAPRRPPPPPPPSPTTTTTTLLPPIP